MKKFIVILILFFIALFNNVFAAEQYRIRPACFDISGSLIFLPIKTNSINPITNNIQFSKMDDKNGVILEIKSAMIDNQYEDLFFSTGNLKEFQIVQQTPSSVKIAMYFKDNYNVSNVKIGNINNNIVITMTPLQPYGMNYYINTYRENDNPKDYREDLLITSRTIEKQVTPIANTKNINKSAMNEINQAFSNSNYQTNEVFGNYEVKNVSENNTLRSKYYVNNISIKDNLFSISGIGTVGIQKPFLLEKPLRMVFDLPNTLLNKNLSNKEFVLTNGDKIKAGQFTTDTTRLVVTSEQAAKYIPVYSADSQSLLITNPQNLLTSHLPAQKTNIVKTAFQKSSDLYNLIFEFDKPICYAIKRTSGYFFVYFLNAERYNESNFKSVIRSTLYDDSIISLMKNTGMRLSIPMANIEDIDTYLSPDGRVFKISSKKVKVVEPEPKKEEKPKVKKTDSVIRTLPKYTGNKNHNVVVIDAGHGGKDCGALRDNVYEKDITLDVSQRLQAILQKKGLKVYMTRTNDTYVSLQDRTTYTEGINPAIFVSVHVNSCNVTSPKGIETHYYHDNSIELANCVHTKLTKRVSNTPNRGLLKSRFYVINHTTVPAILVEIGFISNPEEKHEMTTPQRKQATAEGIAEGIIEYLNKQK